MKRATSSLAKMLSSGERPPEEAFLLDLDYATRQLNQGGKPSTLYNPSSMNCIRQMYYKAIGTECNTDRNSDLIGITQSGADRHERIQSVIFDMHKFNIDCQFYSVPVYIRERGLNLSVSSNSLFESRVYDSSRNLMFACDGIIRYKNKLYILEIKTESSFKWNSRAGVAQEHLRQAFTYSLELDIPDVLFIYENRDTCQKKSYVVNVSDNDRQSIIDLITSCSEHVKSRTLPEKPNTDACRYCGYRKMCDKNLGGDLIAKTE